MCDCFFKHKTADKEIKCQQIQQNWIKITLIGSYFASAIEVAGVFLLTDLLMLHTKLR